MDKIMKNIAANVSCRTKSVECKYQWERNVGSKMKAHMKILGAIVIFLSLAIGREHPQYRIERAFRPSYKHFPVTGVMKLQV